MRYRVFAVTAVAAAVASAGSLAVFAWGGSALAGTTAATPSAVHAAARPHARARATASSHIYLQLAGVTGDVTLGTYAGDFTASDYSWGVSHSIPPVPATVGGGGGAEQPTLSGVTVDVSAGSALATLSQDALTSRYLTSALITEVNAAGNPIRTLALSPVLVSGFRVTGATYRATQASLLLGFNTVTTTDYSSDGTTVLDTYCWDATLNGACQTSESASANTRHRSRR